MSDENMFWDPTLRHESADPPAFPASALPGVMGHPVQSLFFSVDPWAVCSVLFYASCVTLLWGALVYSAIHVMTLGFESRPLYVCRIKAVHASPYWFNLTSTSSVKPNVAGVYDILFDEELPNEEGLLFVNSPRTGPICLTLTSPDPPEMRTPRTRSFIIDWAGAGLGTQLQPDDLVLQRACVYFESAQETQTPLEPVDTDYE